LAIQLLMCLSSSDQMRPPGSIQFALAMTLCLCAGSWGQDVATAGRGPTINSASDIPAGSQLPATSSSRMVLGPSDVIHISVWKNSDLSQTVTVGPDGFVSLPLVGNLQVAGFTADQLGKTIASRLTTYVVNPEVTVSIVEIRSRQVYILGQVSKPGGFPLIAPIHVLQLIAEAGGLTNYANRKGIVVLRPEQGGMKKIPFNYNNVVRGDGKQNIVLLPGDTVFVP
jgi:polysaccharide export outer membrane protein